MPQYAEGAFPETLHPQLARVIAQVERVVIGKRAAVETVLVAVLGGGHVLVEDVPGVGKTVLVRALAKALGCSFARIQFTPDLLPSDVTGVSVYDPREGRFSFRPGPVMANIVLANEINRTSPRTQAALLEAMEEGSVTVDGVTHDLPRPFVVLATQNPVEFEGTYPLPEAQRDRFLLTLRLGYPTPDEEVTMLTRRRGAFCPTRCPAPGRPLDGCGVGGWALGAHGGVDPAPSGGQRHGRGAVVCGAACRVDGRARRGVWAHRAPSPPWGDARGVSPLFWLRALAARVDGRMGRAHAG